MQNGMDMGMKIMDGWILGVAKEGRGGKDHAMREPLFIKPLLSHPLILPS
jgi:hypothetical protein